MNNELVRYAAGTVDVPRSDRQVAARAKQAYDEVRLAALKVDGALALAGHIMDGVVGLDNHRQALSNGDPVTDVLLADIQINAVRKVKAIQNGLYDEWGL